MFCASEKFFIKSSLEWLEFSIYKANLLYKVKIIIIVPKEAPAVIGK